MEITLAGERLILHPFRALYWPAERALLVADLHLGKAFHFRREGIALPGQAEDSTWDRLIALLLEYQPARLVILGDLFHSAYNPVWEEWGDLLGKFSGIKTTLVAGNHDQLSAFQYQKFSMEVCAELEWGPFWCTHHPPPTPREGFYALSGHIHPGVILRGAARQSLRLPCFFFGKQQGILPAFGQLTGLAILHPQPGDRVFVLSGSEIFAAGTHKH